MEVAWGGGADGRVTESVSSRLSTLGLEALRFESMAEREEENEACFCFLLLFLFEYNERAEKDTE